MSLKREKIIYSGKNSIYFTTKRDFNYWIRNVKKIAYRASNIFKIN